MEEKITDSEANHHKNNIIKLVKTLSRYFVGRNRKQVSGNGEDWDEVIFLMAIAVVAREPMLIIGEPGIAKTDMVVRFSEAIGAGENYFEYLLTMFTEPSEVIGPVDIKLLKDGKYRRILENHIANAKIAFLDEIFKGNSAILNTLLTLLNEHKVYDGSEVHKLEDDKLMGFFAASNEIPENVEILPLKDRFPIKIKVNRVPDEEHTRLIDVGVKNDVERNSGVKEWANNECSIEDFIQVRKFLFERFSEKGFRFKEETENLFLRMIQILRSEHKISISDRQIIKLYRLVATRAYLDRGASPDQVEKEDLIMLKYTAERIGDFEKVEKFVSETIGG